MKVVFLTACNSRSAGGLFFTITEYTKALKRLGVNVTVVGFNNEFSEQDLPVYGNVPVVVYERIAMPLLSTFGYSNHLIDILNELKPDIIHVQGLWMYHSWAALKYKRKNPDTKIVIEPHGMLDPWALRNSGWKKKLVGHLFEYENLEKADCIHALCESEKKSILSLGFNSNVEVISNGVVIPTTEILQKSDTLKKILLYIGRIHPKKGLMSLIDAFALARQKEPAILYNWKCRIAGWDQNEYRAHLEAKVREYELGDSIEFIGPVFNEVKKQELINADAFILPSLSEGLPMSILEAWSYGVPALMTDYCNLPEGFSYNAAIRIEPNPEGVLMGLQKLNSYSVHELRQIGGNARDLVKKRFSWDSIALKTLNLYNKL